MTSYTRGTGSLVLAVTVATYECVALRFDERICCGKRWLELANRAYIIRDVGFHRGWTELFSLLGYYVAWGGLKPTFRNYQSVPNSRVNLSKKLDRWRWDRSVGPNRRFQTTSRRVITQTMEEFWPNITSHSLSFSIPIKREKNLEWNACYLCAPNGAKICTFMRECGLYQQLCISNNMSWESLV
jgi:hypothetical protein